MRWAIICVVWTQLENVIFANHLQILYTYILSITWLKLNEFAHSKSCIEQHNKYCAQCASANGLHPVTWLSCPYGKAITYFLTYIGIRNTFVPLKFCHLGWHRYICLAHDLIYALCAIVLRIHYHKRRVKPVVEGVAVGLVDYRAPATVSVKEGMIAVIHILNRRRTKTSHSRATWILMILWGKRVTD